MNTGLKIEIEKMWRQRFGIDLSALERLRILLQQPEEWQIDFLFKKLKENGAK
jgi:hypothetical protein